MPGKIFAKLTRSGHVGQVLTAGGLLAIAALLVFAVATTLEPAPTPPVAKTAPVSEPVQPLPSVQPPLPAVSISQLPAGPQPPADELSAAAAGQQATAVGHEAIQDLWRGAVIREFGWQFHPLYQDWRYNNGLDISGGEGQIVPALLSGEVVEIYTDKQHGLTVAVQSGRYTVHYGSLASVAVNKNTRIKAGSPVGSMGISASEPEPHLHLAVQGSSGTRIDPRELFPDLIN